MVLTHEFDGDPKHATDAPDAGSGGVAVPARADDHTVDSARAQGLFEAHEFPAPDVAPAPEVAQLHRCVAGRGCGQPAEDGDSE